VVEDGRAAREVHTTMMNEGPISEERRADGGSTEYLGEPTERGRSLKITPLDIRKQTFKRAVRGFDVAEVSAFLEAVAAEFEGLVRENTAFVERMRELDEKIDDYRRLEKTLQQTLIRAQETAAEQVDNARKEAELTLREARVKAQEAVADAEAKASELASHVSQLKKQLAAFITRFRGIIDAQAQMLDAQSAHLEGGIVVPPELAGARGPVRAHAEPVHEEVPPARTGEEAQHETERPG